MKKLLLALAVLLGLASPALAGVPCSVPFNLTNGTIADASQVMANYNAILQCLSVSTAHNGANTDITSLGAVTSIGPLTTPITPAQGGAQALCGASGYKVINNTGTPNTELDITWDEAIVTNTSGVIQRSTSGAVTLNFGTIGAANGLDAGSQTADTIYYIWLIGNGTLVNSLASLSPTTPTMPTGYTFKCRLSAAVTDDTGLLLTFVTKGNRTMATVNSFEDNTSLGFLHAQRNTGCGVEPQAQTLTGLPLTATTAIGRVMIVASAQAALGTGPNFYGAATITGSTQAAASQGSHYFEAPLYVTQTLYWCSSTNSNDLEVFGWIDNTNAH